MKQSLGLVAGALGCGLFLVFGCGGSSFEGAEGGGGSHATAGTSSGGDSTAGSSSAGKTGGGESDGGSSSGGVSNGGSATAGAGGTTTAGSATGGSSTGGSNGGAGGSAAMSCEQDTDCMACAYPTAPQTTGDCYCASCASKPMSKASCMANQAQHAKVCGNVHLPCPAIACVLPPEPVCRSHMCVAK
jgi:hypothetical protein